LVIVLACDLGGYLVTFALLVAAASTLRMLRTLRFARKTNRVRSTANNAAARLANTTDRVQATLHRFAEHTHERHCF
jgi:hypothetical protein